MVASLNDAQWTGATSGPTPSRYFHAVAIDFDGTLGEAGVISPEALEALRTIRAEGMPVILVTGRILDELRAVCPGIDGEVDAIVAENGAVIAREGRTRAIVHPVDRRLTEALSGLGVVYRAGDVLLACSAVDEVVVLGEIRRLGHDYQLVRNRGELMVLPAGVTKGSGLAELLGEIGISCHNTVGIGDAENDESLLEVCELSVAVANAVDAIKEQADIVLEEHDGRGVASFLRGPILSGSERRWSSRFELLLGRDDAGADVTLPSSQLNLLITGGSGEGKSYLAGLIAEQLIALGYLLLVIDPEGDYDGLGELAETVLIDAEKTLSSPEMVTKLLARGACVVIDLSAVGEETRSSYLGELLPAVESMRQRTGQPQWVIIDEASDALEHDILPSPMRPSGTGLGLVTWRPLDLSPVARSSVDAVLLTGGRALSEPAVALAAAVSGVPEEQITQLALPSDGRILLARRDEPPISFIVGDRSTRHFRHEHKYGLVGVDEERRFYLRHSEDVATGSSIGNLDELRSALTTSPESVLAHHCAHRDFSRWIAEVFRDVALAQAVQRIEDALEHDDPAAIDVARGRLLIALSAR